MKLHKLFIGLLALAFTACGEDAPDEVITPSPEVSANCPSVRFSSANVSSIEIDPTSPSFEVAVKRNASDAASYTINVVENESDAFVVPSSVSFASGETETTLSISMASSAPTGTPLALSIAFGEENVNPYLAEFGSYNVTATVVKWNTLGEGQWLDGFWFGFASEVTIQQRDDDPSYYRCTNPYIDSIVIDDGNETGTYTTYLTFQLSGNGSVTWDKWFYINILYEGVDIKGYLPSAYSSGQAGNDANSYAELDEEGNILYFAIDAYWHVDNAGGWGCGYPCYMAFPGVDLATEWEW